MRWSEFQDLDQRPAGQSEDAQINPETEFRNPVTVQVRGQWKLAELELVIVINSANTSAVRSTQSADLLKHEQGHFDIHGLIVGRELAEELRGLRARTNPRLGTQLRQAARRARQRAQRLTNQYDQDTHHGRNADRQGVWDRQIQNAINNNTRLTAP